MEFSLNKYFIFCLYIICIYIYIYIYIYICIYIYIERERERVVLFGLPKMTRTCSNSKYNFIET